VHRTLIALLLLAGCGTKVLDLGPPDAAAPPPGTMKVCVDELQANGSVCRRCYLEGTDVGATCSAPVPPPGASPAPCYVKADPMFTRCLYCGGKQLACLKCEPPPPSGGCQQCAWTDLPKEVCLECGKDECNARRPEMIAPGP
jgi:hypothetical protein